jgi:predicted HicB family RNase H-like nuclease
MISKEVKTMNILIRGMDKEIWKRARVKAVKEEMSMNQIVIKLIRMWVKGEVVIEVKGVKKSKY